MYFKNIKMKKNKLFRSRASGFTLIEVIVTIVVAAILGAMLATFMKTNITGSANPVIRVGNEYNLGQVMENITANYKKMIATDSTPLATIKSSIGAAGSTVNNAYGSYKVINNDYITFNCSGSSCSASSGGSLLLKVTIADPLNTQTITVLFTQ
ncbi:MAG: prepilin-type N-terminal cleavage/methylation domain-containing protein [Deltaproteobacteria bacterium]|nr:prepilin-type N-terminal cleavage/methylation domain-containing protein [Deltaproteobacteria bacterium]